MPKGLSQSIFWFWFALLTAFSFASGQTRKAPTGTKLDVFPKHFLLHPGERIHYTMCESRAHNQPHCPDAEFASADHEIVRLINPRGLFEAVRPGRTEIVARTPTGKRRVAVQVTGRPETPMRLVPHNAVREIIAKELLFVGHANLDGFDHTAIAKPGIDRLVREAKENHWTVVYWVSQEYPDWYTTDRNPDYAIISEGQEHQIRIEAQRIVFSGGGFMFCLARNAQMTLHGMITNNVGPRVHFVFPARAIWRGSADSEPYPEGISKECGKGGKPALWLSMLSTLCHFHGLLWRG